MLSPEQWAFIRDVGFGGLMLIALIGGMRRWYVWGWIYKDEVEEKLFWRGLALRSMGQTDKAIDLAAKKDEA